ncbi:MAG: DUF3244 domain-containing protein [Bacteroidales bacterium]|nr:DUF3244 domain-containing protein [Bacteroidales bacterium]MBR6931588.1 DUF3244 domain-containing protein [Bacteroidales bacterium]
MRHTSIKQFALLLGMILPMLWCGASSTISTSGYSHIQIKESHVQNSPRGSSIQASINGHNLMVAFTENLGQVDIEVATASGISVQFTSTPTPNGIQCYIPNAGDYVVTFTLSDGDEYYGEFRVTD